MKNYKQFDVEQLIQTVKFYLHLETQMQNLHYEITLEKNENTVKIFAF